MAMDYTGSFNEHSKATSSRRDAMDFDDLQHAIAGQNVGRQRRHIQDNDIDPLTGKSRKESAAQRLRDTLDWLLAHNQQYRINHEKLITSAHETASVAQSAIERVVSEISNMRSAMDELLSSAAKLQDGTKVFRDKDGNIVGEDGKIIPPELTASIEWRGSEPSYEEYSVLKHSIVGLEDAERELRGIDTEIGGLLGRATDNENPFTPEQQHDAQDRVNALKEHALEIERNVEIELTGDKNVISHAAADVSLTSTEVAPVINFGSKP